MRHFLFLCLESRQRKVTCSSESGELGDGFTVCIAAEIPQRGLGATKRPFGIDDPLLAEGLPEQRRECLAEHPSSFSLPWKPSFPRPNTSFNASWKLTTEHLGPYIHGKEKNWHTKQSSTSEVGPSRRGARHSDQWMMFELLIPTMEHAEEADVSTQVFRVTCDL